MSFSLELVLEIHRDQIGTFGGEPGVRDRAGLEVFGQALHPTVPLKAAAYLYHLALNHPFVDGNKRVAWAVMETYLLLQGFELLMDDDEAYSLTVQVAQGNLTKEEISGRLERALAAG